jgi:Transposase DDE domain group 1
MLAVRRGIVLDMDSSVSPTYGEQEMSAWNGHFACTCYHPLFLFNQFGDLERCMLRPGNVHSADGWESVLRPVIERYKGKVSRIYFRADAAFANPEVYEFLEAERIKYAIRLPANRVLQERRGPTYFGFNGNSCSAGRGPPPGCGPVPPSD